MSGLSQLNLTGWATYSHTQWILTNRLHTFIILYLNRRWRRRSTSLDVVPKWTVAGVSDIHTHQIFDSWLWWFCCIRFLLHILGAVENNHWNCTGLTHLTYQPLNKGNSYRIQCILSMKCEVNSNLLLVYSKEENQIVGNSQNRNFYDDLTFRQAVPSHHRLWIEI